MLVPVPKTRLYPLKSLLTANDHNLLATNGPHHPIVPIKVTRQHTILSWHRQALNLHDSWHDQLPQDLPGNARVVLRIPRAT
jgi:hypothetical protein